MTALSSTGHDIRFSTGAAQLEVLRNLRNKLIGNEYEKLAHSKDDTIPALLEIISDQQTKDPACRIEACVLICSFSFGGL